MNKHRPLQLSVENVGDISAGEVAEAFEMVRDHVADHFGSNTHSPVIDPQWSPRDLKDALPLLPANGMPLAQVISLFEKNIAPGLLRWNHPRFAAYFSTSVAIPAIIADTFTAAYNSNRMLRSASPASVELDGIVGVWCAELLKIPKEFTSHFFVSASESHLHALLAAIGRKTEGRSRSEGLIGGQRFAIYTSELGHFFARKNAVATGLGEKSVRKVPADEQGRLLVPELRQMIIADIRAGVQPLMVIATVGTTSITSVDPVPQIAALCREFSIFSYVDAAYGGAFAALPECAWIAEGWNLVDAICINPHKTLFVPQGCSLLYLRDCGELRRICDHRAEYLPSSTDEGDPMDFSLWCGLRVNSLPLVFNLLVFGAEGIRVRLRRILELARFAVNELQRHPHLELLEQPRFGVVCFTIKEGGYPSPQQVMVKGVCHETQKNGACWITTTHYKGREWFRLALGNLHTSTTDVTLIIAEVARIAQTHSKNQPA